MKRILIILFYAFTTASLLAAKTGVDERLKFPILTGKIADGAGALSPAQKEELNEMLHFQERFDKVEIIVATISSTPKDGLEWYGAQLAGKWGYLAKKPCL